MTETSQPRPLNVGDTAPSFSLPLAQGGVATLEDAIKQGPVLLWFAPGMV